MTDGERTRIVGELVEEHAESLYRFAYRLSGSAADAEDLVQQAFVAAQRKLDQLRDREKARSWLLSIVRNAFLKSRQRPAGTPFDSFDGVADPSWVPSSGAVDGEELQAALNELPEDYRIPVVLFYFEEMTYRQIAVHLNIPEGTVMSRLSRGKAYLRQRLIARLGEDAPLRLPAESTV